jgi:hypothetical protein
MSLFCCSLQTFWNCWNNGIGNQLGTAKRRCSTYRNSFVPAILQADCLHSEGARFNDFNYAFSGFNGFATGELCLLFLLPSIQILSLRATLLTVPCGTSITLLLPQDSLAAVQPKAFLLCCA